MKPSKEQLAKLLSYDAETGQLVWLVARNGSAGRIAGSPNSEGYIQVKIGGVLYKAHHLAFVLVTGFWPDDQVDHIDGNRQNNRFVNLRQCNASENACNRKARSDNTSGVPGVTWNKEESKWRVRVQKNGKRLLVGDYRNYDDAVSARALASVLLQGEFSSEMRL
jgi:hypothetical protein